MTELSPTAKVGICLAHGHCDLPNLKQPADVAGTRSVSRRLGGAG